MKLKIANIKWKKVIKWVILLVVIIIIISVVYNRVSAGRLQNTSSENVITTQKVETRDIQNVLTSSGTISPLNTYDVTTLVEGEVIEADFEEGDTVEAGQVLYKIDTDTLDNQIGTAQTTLDRANKNLTKAENSYQDALDKLAKAQKDYDEAKAEFGDPAVRSEVTGYVKTLYVDKGDTVQKGSQIAEIYDNSTMELTLPFSSAEADQSLIGKSAEVVLEATDETIKGKVTKVSNIDEALSGNRLVNQVTIEVKNPGGITTSTTATASIGSIYSSAEGTFAVKTQTVISAEYAGKITDLKLVEGSQIKEGDILYILSEDSVEDLLEQYSSKLESAQDAVSNAQDGRESAAEAIEDADSKLQEIIDTRTDYSVTAPISGIVISKDALVGDTIRNTSALCTIYDMSAVTFEMNVDELDVINVKEGQEVEITADAFEGQQMKGVVTNVSLQSNANQGVTQYPVTVRIDEIGNLLPGMNVTGSIIIEKAAGVMAIPADALMRGDVVYVKDASVTEAVGEVPAGFKEVKVETGITDGDFIEIKSGLTGNEEVYVKRISEAVTFTMPGGFGGMRSQGGFGGNGNTGGNGNRSWSGSTGSVSIQQAR